MRIARVLTRLNLGGPARQVLASDPLLAARGHVLRLFVGTPEPGEGDLFDELAARGLDLVRLPGLRRGISPARDLLVQRRLRRELAAFRPDVVHTHASKAGALGRRALASSKAFRDVARVHTFHGHVLEDYFPRLVSERLVALERKLARDTDRIVAVSHATADDLLRLQVVPEEKLVVIQPGVELAGLRALSRPGPRSGPLHELLGADASAVLIGVIGRLAEVKQPTLAVRLFEELHLRYPELQLVFVGDGPQRRALERSIVALGAVGERRVHLVGARSDMVPVLAELDGVLSVSRNEGLPVALIEAAAAGLAVVARDVGGVGELVVHERTGFLGTTDAELAYGLGLLLEHPEERRAQGERARLRVVRLHGAEVLASRLEELYRVVVEERRGARRP